MLDVVRPLSELSRRPNRERPLVFHASMGSWPVFEAVRRERELILVYHNFSPPEAFVPFSPEVAGDLVRGRWELEQIRPQVAHAIAASEFNAAELEALGAPRVEVIPPTPDTERLKAVWPDPHMWRQVAAWCADPLIVSVASSCHTRRGSSG